MEKVSAACAMEWSIKLEKALRSKNLARAVEAIRETGGKLERWSRELKPTAAVYNLFDLVPEEDRLFANTIILRLVDAFCSGDKLVKQAVARVFMSMLNQGRRKKRTERELGFLSKERVENHLEFLKRVKIIYENGDMEDKAMALVLFGCWRDFSSEYSPIRYMILTSMVSSHDLEVRSSLFAAACFCEVADDFALVVLGMLVKMMKLTELTPKSKVAAVRVFAKLGCSYTIADKAFKTGLKLMMETSEEAYVVALLVSLTKLASRSTHLASELRATVISFLDEDKTSHVRAVSLRCLHFLVEKGMCFSLVHETTIEMLSRLLNKSEISPDMQLRALQILQKILLYKLCTADASECSQLMIIIENASHSPIMSSIYSAIGILLDLVEQILETAKTRFFEVPSTSLLHQVIELIIDRVFSFVGRSYSDPFQADCVMIRYLFNLLLRVVGKHSEAVFLVLDQILSLLEVSGTRADIDYKSLAAYILGFLTMFLENLEVVDAVSSQIIVRVKNIVEFVRSRSFFDLYTRILYSLILHSKTFEYEIFTLESSNKILKERDFWTAYRAGVYAARSGVWVPSAFIFEQLRSKVQTDVYVLWLRSLTYFAYAEGNIKLLSSSIDGSMIVNWLTSNDYLPEISKNSYGISDLTRVLHDAYENLTSSREGLSEAFCFQGWFLSLRARMLGTALVLVKQLDLFNHENLGSLLNGSSFVEKFMQVSVQLRKLAAEFDTLATCFVNIDRESSNIIETLALSCSVLGFAAGSILFVPELSSSDSQSGLYSKLIRDLAERLWLIDPEISKNLCLLIKGTEPLNNKGFHLRHRNQRSRVCGKVKILLSICRDSLSGILRLRDRANVVLDENLMSEITMELRHLLRETAMKWILMPFSAPKYFFCVRPFVGSELFIRNSDGKNRDTISVEHGFQLSLDLCLQLRNIQSKRRVLQVTRLYCILYCRLAFHVNERGQARVLPWDNEDLVEMSDRLFCYAANPRKRIQRNGNSGNGVSAIVELEPSERGQGFSRCLLDVSDFPEGSYEIKWQSGCIDSRGCFWNLLPLGPWPVFRVYKGM